MILNLGKNRGAVQKEAVELWSAKYKNDQDKTGLQCFLAGKVTPIIKPIKSFFMPQEKVKFESKVDMVCVEKPVDLDTNSPTEVPCNARPANQIYFGVLLLHFFVDRKEVNFSPEIHFSKCCLIFKSTDILFRSYQGITTSIVRNVG